MSLLIKTSTIGSLFNCLSAQGVEMVFGSKEKELQISAEQFGIRYFQLNHEQGAAHAADGFARVTGKPGVVVLTTAAGISNSITGIATAYSDSVPLVLIAGPLTDKNSNSSFQEFDIAGVRL